MRSEIALNYNKYFTKKKLKKLPAKIRYKGWFLLKILEQRKVRKIYGNITLTRLKNIYKNILKNKVNFFINFLKILEYRLDVLVFKLNLFTSINYCQNLIRLKQVQVNNQFKNLNYVVKVNDIIKILYIKNKQSTGYVLNFIYKDKYYNTLKQVDGIYLYRFLLNLNLFKTLKQIYFYIKKGLILVNGLVIKFPRYKLAFNKTKIVIKNLGIKSNFKLKIKNYSIIPVTFNDKYFSYYKKNFNNYAKYYIFNLFRFYSYQKKYSISSMNNLLLNFINKNNLFSYKKKVFNIKQANKLKIFNITRTISKITYNQPIILKYKWLKDLNLEKKKLKNIKNFIFLYNFKRKNLFIFKLKKKLYFVNNNTYFFNKAFKRIKLKKRIYKFSVLKNNKFLLNTAFLKKYNLNKSQHLEVNYKINTAILLKYFNLNSISSRDLIYLGIVSYYFFQYT